MGRIDRVCALDMVNRAILFVPLHHRHNHHHRHSCDDNHDDGAMKTKVLIDLLVRETPTITSHHHQKQEE